MLLRLISLGILTFAAASAAAQGPDRWTMEETTRGKAAQTIRYERTPQPDGGAALVCHKDQRTLVTTVDRQGTTVHWRRTDVGGPSLDLSLDSGVFTVVSAGAATQFPGGSKPWIQDLNLLAPFVLGAEREIRFTAFADFLDSRLKASDMTVFKATKVGQETQSWVTGAGPTWRVRVTFDDLRSAFWGADYWYRVSDGQLVRYEEVRGGPGTPPTVGRLAENR